LIRQKKIRKRVESLLGRNSALSSSDTTISESFGKGLCKALEIDFERFDTKELREWIIGFAKIFILPIQHPNMIVPTQQELYDYGYQLGQQMINPIVTSLQEQQIIAQQEPQIQQRGLGIISRMKQRVQQPTTTQPIQEDVADYITPEDEPAVNTKKKEKEKEPESWREYIEP